MTWKDIGSPNIDPTPSQLLAFNRSTSQPLGVLPQFPIMLGGKIVYIDVMVVQGPLDFNFLLGCDYIYAMKSIVSTLFRMMHFPHNGNILTIDQFYFINNCTSFLHPTSFGVPNILATSPEPHAYYMASYPRHSISNEKEPLISCSTSLDLDSIVNLVSLSMGAL